MFGLGMKRLRAGAVLVVIVTGLCCATSALANPLVTYDNSYHVGFLNGEDGTLLRIRADDCPQGNNDRVFVHIGKDTFRAWPCQGRSQGRYGRSVNVVDASFEFDQQDNGGAALSLSSFDVDKSGHWPLVVVYNSKTIFRGVVHVKNTYVPGHRIWQGTDAFINVCINNGYKLISEHLRLYCETPDHGTSVTTITRP